LPSSKVDKGDLVRYRVPYNDDPDIIRDAGTGVVVEIIHHSYTTSDKNTRDYKVFKVYRTKFSDIITVTENNVQLLETEEKE
jgi:hypothetical protein